MKKLSLIFASFIFLLLTACNNEDPTIEIEVKIAPVSDDEYSNVGATKDLNEPKQEDFKVLEYTLHMEHSDDVTIRQIESFDDWKNVLNGIDDIDRYWYGSASSLDNTSENFAEYSYQLVYYAKGLSQGDIKQAFNNSIITVAWTDDENQQIEKQYNIAELIEFSKK
ncbi:hypothetical protein [Solibacillus cecembensis]|uniref:hypothetical protein n=1 Tax=Solibacillus cecembensis TaxID=459347 RepID=UPI0007172C67